jgi:hypothetical protein
LSWNLGTLTSWNPLGHSRPVTGLLYLYYHLLSLLMNYNGLKRWGNKVLLQGATCNFNDSTETWNNLLAISNKRNFTLTFRRQTADLPHKRSHVFWWKGLEEGRTCWHWPSLQQIHRVQRTLCLGISREVMSPVLFSISYASSVIAP